VIKHLDKYDFSLLSMSKRGIEREGLRVSHLGEVAKTSHPSVLGKKLMHPYVTVDFSEGLLEIITPPLLTGIKCLDFLKGATAYTQQNMCKSEMVWSSSIPPNLNSHDIEIADFGTNNSAKMKKVYREGLALRYGKNMQVIAGIHYNFSIADDFLDLLDIKGTYPSNQDRKNALYFRLIKRYYKISWLIPYLFGCSPICSKSLTSESNIMGLDELDGDHIYGEYATSLRMSDLGYKSLAQENLFVSCRNINSYVRDLLKATDTRYPDYIRSGVKNKSGEYKQLNDSILQIENEYYNSIRPKQVANPGERPANALLERGVEYIELRSLDIDIFTDVGISEDTSNFIEVYLLSCMLADEIEYNENLVLEANDNFSTVVKTGRKPELELTKDKRKVSLQNWGLNILNSCMDVAQRMDAALSKECKYQIAVENQIIKIKDSSKTPSAILLKEIKSYNGNCHDWFCNKSYEHMLAFQQYSIPSDLEATLKQATTTSIKEWEALETSSSVSFDIYLKEYFAS
jgi:glutamate--cysteine ligase